jgi:hypothetical protein
LIKTKDFFNLCHQYFHPLPIGLGQVPLVLFSITTEIVNGQLVSILHLVRNEADGFSKEHEDDEEERGKFINERGT